ncbi:MAG TPA: hypothetical protein VE973_00775, partial [Candidatus Limnocylindria bacterium]|nr:hypothetical protein [Candidatus Limnocylindria bacterium]
MTTKEGLLDLVPKDKDSPVSGRDVLLVTLIVALTFGIPMICFLLFEANSWYSQDEVSVALRGKFPEVTMVLGIKPHYLGRSVITAKT